MGKTLFLSDFDGTMSPSEFYLRYVEKYCPNEDRAWLNQCLRGEITSFTYLYEVLAFTPVPPNEFQEHLVKFPKDPNLSKTHQWLGAQGIDFAVVSAGCIGYIQPMLELWGLKNIPIYANGVRFEDNRMLMLPAEEPFAAPYFGIDKAEVVRHLRKTYDTIIFAGDGSSDFGAAQLADYRFARDVLARKLRSAQIPFYPFEHYNDILETLITKKAFF